MQTILSFTAKGAEGHPAGIAFRKAKEEGCTLKCNGRMGILCQPKRLEKIFLMKRNQREDTWQELLQTTW